MRAVEIMREELAKRFLDHKAPVHVRRELTNAIKTAQRQGENPRTVVNRLLPILMPK